MSTLYFTPAADMDIVADQNRLAPATIFTFLDKDTGNPVDMSVYDQQLAVKDGYAGAVVCEWNTDDDSITIGGVDSNEVTLESKTSGQMNFTAKKYYYDWTFTIPGSDPVSYFRGVFALNPTI